MNGDGYADLLVSVPAYSNGELEEGAAFLFNGSSSGMASGNPTTASIETSRTKRKRRSWTIRTERWARSASPKA